MTILSENEPRVAGGRTLPAGPGWRDSMRSAVRDPVELCRLLELPPECEAAARRAAEVFGVFVPREYLKRMRPGYPDDPLVRQILPLAAELDSPPGFTADPTGDAAAAAAPGLLHKYHGRVLLVTTGACGVHCRYCFRRHFAFDELPKSADAWQQAVDHVAADRSIREVILSGGDPLTIGDGRLSELADRLAAVGHVRRLRLHTRMPIVIPTRVCDELLGWLCDTRLVPVVVVAANHPAEIDEAVAAALARLVDAGIPVLNQAVLLRGVNDDADTLAELCERLVDLRVMPYYLHQLDRVAGGAHFEVPLGRGDQLMEQLRARLPGYAVPRYVREESGAAGKVLLCSTQVAKHLI